MKQQASFLQNFQLNSITNSGVPQQTSTPLKRGNQLNNSSKELPKTPDVRRQRRPKVASMVLAKCPSIPVSSPAGQQLSKTSKTAMNEEYLKERLERVERFCPAPILGMEGTHRPRFMDRHRCGITTSSSFKKSATTEYYHQYQFPRRQISNRSRQEAFRTLNSIRLKQSNCKPVQIQVKRLTDEDIEAYHLNNKIKRLKQMGEITLIKQSKTASSSNVIDIIDLCSSDDESCGSDQGSNSVHNEVVTAEQFMDYSEIEVFHPTQLKLERKSLSNNIQIDTRNLKQLVMALKESDPLAITAATSATLFADEPKPRNGLTKNHGQSVVRRPSPVQNHKENISQYVNGGTNGSTPLPRLSMSPNKIYQRQNGGKVVIVKPAQLDAKMQQQLISIDLTL